MKPTKRLISNYAGPNQRAKTPGNDIRSERINASSLKSQPDFPARIPPLSLNIA